MFITYDLYMGIDRLILNTLGESFKVFLILWLIYFRIDFCFVLEISFDIRNVTSAGRVSAVSVIVEIFTIDVFNIPGTFY